jgi:hypothetical protein
MLNRDTIITELNLNDLTRDEIVERLFCAALLKNGTDITSKVLKDYIELRDIVCP